MTRKRLALTELSDDALKRISRVIGEQSAAQQAIRSLVERRERGEDAAAYWDRDRQMILVGPRLTKDPST